MNQINLDEFKLEVLEWQHAKDISNYIGIPQRDKGIQYSFHISTFDILKPNVYHVNVGIEDLIENDFIEPSFKTKTNSKFTLHLAKDKSPTELLIFELIRKSGYDYAQEYHKRVAQTALQHRKIPLPVFENLKTQIQTHLDRWDKDERYKGLN
jgi:hypothetical protein